MEDKKYVNYELLRTLHQTLQIILKRAEKELNKDYWEHSEYWEIFQRDINDWIYILSKCIHNEETNIKVITELINRNYLEGGNDESKSNNKK